MQYMLICGFQAVKYLHNTNYFSVSQKNQVYIYDCKSACLHTNTLHNFPLYWIQPNSMETGREGYC